MNVNRGTEIKQSLPPGWRWAKMGEVILEALPGFATGERDASGVIQLRMNNVDTHGRLIWDEFIRVPATEETISKYHLEPGDVVFNNTNSTKLVGKSAVFSGSPEPVVYSNHFTRLRTKSEQLDSSYLTNWLICQWQKKIFENLCNRWIGQSAVKNDKLFQLEIPLPPLAEQKRIAAILNEQMAAVENARAAAEAQLGAAKALKAAFLHQVFPKKGQELPQGWRWMRLGDVFEIKASLVDPRALEFSGMPHVSAEDIESGTGRLYKVQSVSEDGMISGKYLFESGCVLYSKIRPYLRKVALAPFRGLCSADMYPLDINSETAISHFVVQLLLSQAFTEYADAESRRARMPKLNREQLFSYLAPIPPLSDQMRIAANLDEQMKSTELLLNDLEKQLNEINSLPAALLGRAFRGEL